MCDSTSVSLKDCHSIQLLFLKSSIEGFRHEIVCSWTYFGICHVYIRLVLFIRGIGMMIPFAIKITVICFQVKMPQKLVNSLIPPEISIEQPFDALSQCLQFVVQMEKPMEISANWHRINHVLHALPNFVYAIVLKRDKMDILV